MTLARQVITGFSVSSTFTVKLHWAVFALASVAVQVTVWLPTVKVLPLAGTHTILLTVQLSVAVGAKVTALPHWPASAGTSMLAGQVMTGFSVSLMATVKLHEA